MLHTLVKESERMRKGQRVFLIIQSFVAGDVGKVVSVIQLVFL